MIFLCTFGLKYIHETFFAMYFAYASQKIVRLETIAAASHHNQAVICIALDWKWPKMNSISSNTLHWIQHLGQRQTIYSQNIARKHSLGNPKKNQNKSFILVVWRSNIYPRRRVTMWIDRMTDLDRMTRMTGQTFIQEEWRWLGQENEVSFQEQKSKFGNIKCFDINMIHY